MSFKHKFSFEEKVKIVTEYLNGTNGFRESCRIYNVSQSGLKDWLRLYKTFGITAFKENNKCRKYSSYIKKNAVHDYFSRRLSVPEILIKYKMRSTTQLRKWIIKYNSHEELKTSGTGGTTIMTKGRKTTYEERITIVKCCIENENNYAQTAEKYQVSYQQVYTWLKKYETNGVKGLLDRRGHIKPEDEMSELEKLRAENRLLKAENKRKEMEMEFLKKLDEIERRRF
ncbi:MULTISPECIES: transposase [Clostridium]|uniref:Transposase n=1 Tax=Clostridium lapidicellarium TaxID=3240931 RepID=A0ABV4DTC5_9CLOT